MTDPDLLRNPMVWLNEEVDALAYRWRQDNRNFAIATVVDTGGSTPRLKGARLVSDGHYFAGTIGGGAVEKHVLDRIFKLIKDHESSELIQVHLVRDLAMCCGGKMSIFVNRIQPRPSLYIYGAGHIGSALAQLSSTSVFKVHLIDDRETWIDARRHSDRIIVVDRDPVEHAVGLTHAQQDFICIATHAHELDQTLIEKLLQKSTHAAYIGMIGSRGKWLRFKERLLHKGHDQNVFDVVKCPAGIDIGAETPEEIAVSVFAQMIQTFRNQKL